MDWEKLLLDIVNLVISALLPVLATFITYYATKLGKVFFAKKNAILDTELKQQLAYIVVSAVEQIGKKLKGPEKFELAKINLINELEKYGITAISDNELKILIEAVVCSFNENSLEIIE